MVGSQYTHPFFLTCFTSKTLRFSSAPVVAADWSGPRTSPSAASLGTAHRPGGRRRRGWTSAAERHVTSPGDVLVKLEGNRRLVVVVCETWKFDFLWLLPSFFLGVGVVVGFQVQEIRDQEADVWLDVKQKKTKPKKYLPLHFCLQARSAYREFTGQHNWKL